MQNLPQGRELKEIKDIVDFLPKSKRKASEGLDDGKYPFFTSSQQQTKYINEADYKEEALILGTGGIPSIHLSKYFSTSGDTFVIRSKNTNYLLNKYIYKYILGNINLLEKGFKGQGLKHLSKNYLNTIQIPIPPLETQKKIVEKLDETFEDIDKSIHLLEKNIQNIDELNKSVFKDIFYNKDYEGISIENISDIIDGDRGKHYPKKNEMFENGYCLFLNTSNVREGFFDFSTTHFITEEKDSLLRKGKVNYGDIIFTTRGTIGNCALYDNTIDYKNVRINSGMIIIRSKDNINKKFLLHYLKSSEFKKSILENMSGSAQQQLPIRIFKNIKIPLPSLEKQKEIIEYLDKIFETNEQLKQQYQQKLQNLQELKKSTLNSAFEGKLV